MDAAQTIRHAIDRVAALRAHAQAEPELGTAVASIKRLQAQRFAGTYADLLVHPSYQGATRFFLDELYGEHDFAQRDAQFARIADALQRLFPKPVVATATTLAELHLLTEELDFALAQAWLATGEAGSNDLALRYLRAWKHLGPSDERNRQLQMVVDTGHELERLTRLPGLRLMLKVMRRPAMASGLGNLQHFLETGFDTFAALAKQPAGVRTFLGWVHERETGWMASMQVLTEYECHQELTACLARGAAAVRA